MRRPIDASEKADWQTIGRVKAQMFAPIQLRGGVLPSGLNVGPGFHLNGDPYDVTDISYLKAGTKTARTVAHAHHGQ
jgi:hypothetical protein